MVASKREEMDREIDHLLIVQSENLRRYWEVSSLHACWPPLCHITLLSRMSFCTEQGGQISNPHAGCLLVLQLGFAACPAFSREGDHH